MKWVRVKWGTSWKIVIAGGGTGGHVYPALAIADALIEQGHASGDIHFIGSRRALEARVVPEAGYEITLLSGRGIKRSLSFDNVGAVLGLLVGFIRAFALLAWRRPQVVVSVGGYAAAPAALSAVLLRIPLVLAESNAVPGAVHRILGRFARASAVAWPDTKLPRAVVTGNPVRADLLKAHPASGSDEHIASGGDRVDCSAEQRLQARVKLGISENRFLVASFGGSLGAGTINRSVAELVQLWAGRSDIAVYHVVGKRDWGKQQETRQEEARQHLRAEVAPDGELEYMPVEYESDMASLYSAADVLITRSGATTCAEIAAVGVPSILVPLPGSPGDHQTANANVLKVAGAAILLFDSECTGEKLRDLLNPLISDEDRRMQMSKAALTLAQPNAANKIAALINSIY